MNILAKITEIAVQSNFLESGYIDVANLKYYSEVRAICEGNACRNYAASWACPPAVGTITECRERVSKYDKMLLFSQKYELEDSFDFEGMTDGLLDFKKRVDIFQRNLKDILSDFLLLSNEGCGKCSECTYPTAPCRFLDLLHHSLEGYGFIVSELAAEAGIHYNNGMNTITYFGALLFKENECCSLNRNKKRDIQMKNPWKEIPLTDYENHMKLSSVMQLQAMNEMMKGQFNTYPISNVMIFGIAGGNGLEHISKNKFKKVYGVDINPAYLKEVVHRYHNLDGILECLCIDLIGEANKLPKSDMVIANLLIEYIGYECFQKTIQYVCPKYVSCIIQINMEDNWVSDSPYLHVFDGLEKIHHQMEEQTLEKTMLEIDYHAIKTLEHMLPNGKKLVQIDFER